jgi:hypothetical protein
MRHRRFLQSMALVVGAAFPCIAAEQNSSEVPPFFSWNDGFHSESKLLRPGKLDFLYRHRRDDDLYNFFAFTPSFKGGAGMFDTYGGEPARYAGGFLRPLAPWPDKGDLIVGVQGVEVDPRSDYEVQAEYRLPTGLGLGGGFVDASDPTADVTFAKMTFRNRWRGLHYILAPQVQETAGETSPGGYVALYNDLFMGVGGTDGEQWRATFGFIAPARKSAAGAQTGIRTLFRPTAEVLYVDNSIGDLIGPRVLFVNATLGFQGGFLSHPARLGRAMGPQGLEFGNPLGFLFPTWNRRLEVWEMGSLMDARLERIRFPNRTTQERYEAILYPLQFDETPHWVDGLFAGGGYSKLPTSETALLVGGFHALLGFLKTSIGVEYQFQPAQTSVIVGLIDTF